MPAERDRPAIAANGGGESGDPRHPATTALACPEPDADANDNNLQATTLFNNRVDSLLGKVDQHIGAVDLLTVRYFFGDSDQSFPLGLLGGGFLPGYNTDTPTTAPALGILHARRVAEAARRAARRLQPLRRGLLPGGPRVRSAVDRPEHGQQPAGLRPPAHPRVWLRERRRQPSLPRGRVDSNYQLFGNMSYTRPSQPEGRLRVPPHDRVDGFFDAGYRGRLDFDSLEDFIAGRIAGGRQAKGDSRRFTFQNNHSFYAQDTFNRQPEGHHQLGSAMGLLRRDRGGG